jgi:hypothetical protein
MSVVQLDLNNLVPLTREEEWSYSDEKKHAELLDQHLGLEIEKVEALIAHKEIFGKEAWVGLNPQSLLTPYTELRRMLDLLKLKSGDLVVDLGAGYGRMGWVIENYFSSSNFKGFEIVEERVGEESEC